MASLLVKINDLSTGRAASTIPVVLEHYAGHGEWKEVTTGVTGSAGTLSLTPEKKSSLSPGRYRLTFQTTTYFQTQSQHVFYPYVSLVFEHTEEKSGQEIHLNLTPFGFSTLRTTS